MNLQDTIATIIGGECIQKLVRDDIHGQCLGQETETEGGEDPVGPTQWNRHPSIRSIHHAGSDDDGPEFGMSLQGLLCLILCLLVTRKEATGDDTEIGCETYPKSRIW